MKIQSFNTNNNIKVRASNKQNGTNSYECLKKNNRLKTNQISSESFKGAYGINVNKSPNFGTKPIYPIKLKEKQADGTFKNIPAYFSELEESDEKELKELTQTWTKNGSPYTEEILWTYEDEYIDKLKRPYNINRINCYVIERTDKKGPLKERATAMLSTTHRGMYENKSTKIECLQSAPGIASYCPNYRYSPIKGSGEQAISCVTKLAKKNNDESIRLYSTNNTFYEHIGIKNDKERNHYIIERNEFDSFIKKTEEKYGVNTEQI